MSTLATVMSTLARLAKKGALRQFRDGRACRYELAAPAGSIDDALTARQMLSHLRRRHHLSVHAVDLAVAADPLLLRAAGAVRPSASHHWSKHHDRSNRPDQALRRQDR